MPLTLGTRLGTYEIVATLGSGGMGEVCRAKDLRLGREVALKVLPDAFAHDADRLARFEREARTVAGLNHPNIVVLYSVEDEDKVRLLTAQSVVKELRATLLGEAEGSKASVEVKAEVAKAAKGRGQNAEAHRLYLQARHFIDRFTRDDMEKGVGYLKDTLELDPGFALAWAELGGAYSHQADRGWVPVAEGNAQARAANVRALALEPDLAEGHARLGWAQMLYERDWRGAEGLFRRALELMPGNAAALRGAARLAFNHGRFEEAIDLYRRALEQDPLSSNNYHSLGFAYFHAGRLAEAEQAFRKALELAPKRAVSHARLALVLHDEGRGEEALAEVVQEPNDALRLNAQAIIQDGAAGGVEADDALRELIERHADDAAYVIAEVKGARGEVDAAFEWLARADAQREAGLTDMKNNPRLRSLHGDPRWETFLLKMGLAERCH